MEARLKTSTHLDWVMLISVAILLLFGVVAIWSATGDQTFVFSNLGVRQALYSMIGFGLLFVISRID